MPEGPEVRREADAIARALRDGPLVRVDYRVRGLRRLAQGLDGARVTQVRSRGKVMMITFDRGLTHLSHHQLYGEWRVMPASREPDEDRAVRVVLATARRAAVLYSATDIALVPGHECRAHRLLAHLGPDVLDRATTPSLVASRLRHPRHCGKTLAHLLLDQAFCAGLGNYLRSDILFEARLRADVRPADLDDAARARLARAIVTLPRRSHRTGGVTNDPLRARALAGRGVSFDSRRFLVYGREGSPCWACGRIIRRDDAAGRGWFWCPGCQPAASARVHKR
jgi:endonuclease-8